MPVGAGPYGYPLFQLRSGLIGGLGMGQTYPVADPVDVGVDRDHIHPENETEHNVGAFAADARQRH